MPPYTDGLNVTKRMAQRPENEQSLACYKLFSLAIESIYKARTTEAIC